VAHQVGDADHWQVVLQRETLQVRQAGHVAVVVDDLGDDGRPLQPGQDGEIDAGLGATWTLEYPSGRCVEREDVSGTGEVARRTRRGLPVPEPLRRDRLRRCRS